MLRNNGQVLQYGFGVLAFISGLLCLFFFSWSYPELQPLFQVFNNPVKHYQPGPVFGISESNYQLCRIFYLLVLGLGIAGTYKFRNKRANSFSWLFPVRYCFTRYRTITSFLVFCVCRLPGSLPMASGS
jgi:hypothetical protein